MPIIKTQKKIVICIKSLKRIFQDAVGRDTMYHLPQKQLMPVGGQIGKYCLSLGSREVFAAIQISLKVSVLFRVRQMKIIIKMLVLNKPGPELH